MKLARMVYFIKPIGMDGPVKIGCSRWPTMRRDTLACWSPFPLEVVAEIEGHEDLERRFHALFYDQHKRQEWFDWSPELGRVIADVAAGVFDIATLPPAKRLPRIGKKTGTPKGQKWSEERKAQARKHREVHKAEKLSGLVRDWCDDVDKFIADPFALGITREERARRDAVRRAEYYHKMAEASLSKANDRLVAS